MAKLMNSPKGFRYLPQALSFTAQSALVERVEEIVAHAPFYTPTMPRTGQPFSVEMTNCGPLGWVSDRIHGYRYQTGHPETHKPWPDMPKVLIELWGEITGYSAPPEACLINWYRPKAKLGLHVDADEENTEAPVLSISLGDDAWFRIGGLKRRDPSQRLLLNSGDIVVLGGEARRAYHGIDRIVPGSNNLLGREGRLNLTLRRVSVD